MKFDRRTTEWRVLLDNVNAEIVHDGYSKEVQSREEIKSIADAMAKMVRRSIMAMPYNGAKEICLNCTWK